jgi:hypothetical protein
MESDDRGMDVDDMDYYTEYVLPNSDNNNLITQTEINGLV